MGRIYSFPEFFLLWNMCPKTTVLFWLDRYREFRVSCNLATLHLLEACISSRLDSGLRRNDETFGNLEFEV